MHVFEKVNGFAINCRISDSKGHSLMYNLQKRILACTWNPESLHTYYAQDLARSVVWDFWINYRNAEMYCVLNVEALLLDKLLL